MLDRICPRCEIEMRCKRNDINIVECSRHAPEAIYHADLWQCPECHTEAIAGLARKPWAVRGKDAWTLPTICHCLISEGQTVIRCFTDTAEKQQYAQEETANV